MEISVNKYSVKSNAVTLLISFLIIYVSILVTILLLEPDYFIYFCIAVPLIPGLIYIVTDKLETAFLLYIVVLPIIQHLSVKSIPVGDFRITPDMIIHFILMIALLNQFIFSYRRTDEYTPTIIDKLLIVFVVLSMFSIIHASYFPINHDKRLLLYYSGVIQTITFYFAILFLLKSVPGFTNKMLYALALSTFFAGIVAFVELRNIGLDLINIFLMRNKFGFGYHNANLFGIHAALLFPISIFLLKSEEYKKSKIILWISFLILSILAVLTLNRGTFIVIAFNLIVLFWKRETRKIVIGFLVIGTIGAIYFSDMIFLYVSRFFSDSGGQVKFLRDESALFRIEVWRVGLETILQYPLGVGGNGFHLMWQKISIAPLFYFGTPHQIFLHLGVDYGVPAMIVFIFFIVSVITKSSFLYKSIDLDNNHLFYYIRLSIIGYLIHGFLTGGELSHLWGNIAPNNGFSYILMILIALVSFHLHPTKLTKVTDPQIN